MQDNINNMDQLDDFSKIIRQKLENHQLPDDVPDWSAIEKQLKPKRKIIPWWMWLPIGSAAVLALLFTLRPFNETPTFTKNSEQKNTRSIEKNINQSITKKESDSKNTEKALSNQKAINKQVAVQNKYFKVQVKLISHQVVIKDSIGNLNTLKEINTNNFSENKTIAEIININKDSISSKTSNNKLPDNLPVNQIVEQKTDPVSKPKTKHNWLLAAAFGAGGSGGSGGGSLFGNSDLLNEKGNENLVNAATNYTSILTPNDFTNIVHHAPVSFGLVVRKNLDKVLSFESGLVYTYLFSTFENQGVQHSDAKLHLHYIGVPLNLVAQVWKNPKWELYFSAGGMVEKGIRSVYIQNEYWGNQVITTRAETKIDGFQWSLNSAFGATYKLQRNLGIYFEPKISYYLENNQPMSARTQQPFTVGLNAGLRYEF